jgi:hypothetical protein
MRAPQSPERCIVEHPVKLTNEDRIRLQQRWWQRANDIPLALIYTPMPAARPTRWRGLDVDVPVTEIAERKRAGAETQYRIPKEVLVTGYVNFATALIPAMLGAGFAYDEHTSWAIPTVSSIMEVRITPFDPSQPLFRAYIERVEALLAGWSWDTYLPANYAYLGPLDLLAGLLGPQQLCIDLFDHPDYVKGKAVEAACFLVEMMNYELALFRKAGLTDGTPCAFNYWLPGSGFLFSEDFCALVSRKHYAEFFLEPDIIFCRAVDSAFLHVHSAGAQCVPAILENPYVRGIELANDAGNRDIQGVIEAAKRVQARGLPLQVSSWEHPLDPREMRLVLDELDPHGLLVAFQARSLEEAHVLYRLIKGSAWE